MANRISTVMDNLAAAMETLVAAGTLKAVRRRLIVPSQESNPPVAGLVLDDYRRDGAVWVANALVMVLAARGGEAPDEIILDLVAEADAAIQTAIDAGGLGGAVDSPHWSNWFNAWAKDTGVLQIGSRGTMRIQTVSPLKIPE